MAEFDAAAFMKDVVGGLLTVTQSVKIISEPVTVGNKTVIPAVVAKVGFGAGGGSGSAPTDESEQERAEGSGGGGGGGACMTPIFLIVDEDGERLLTVPGPLDTAASMIGKAKSALDRVMPRKEKAPDLEADDELRDLEEGVSGPAH